MNDPYLPRPAEIVDVKQQTYDTKTYRLRLVDDRGQEKLVASPGQFIMVSVPGLGEAPFSLSSEPDRDGFLETTVRRVGNLTGVLDRLHEGARIGIRGPYGKGWPVKDAIGHDVLIVAGGIGLAPLRPMIKTIQKNRTHYGTLEILYGARTPTDEMFVDEYEEWKTIKDTTLTLTVDSVPKGSKWPHRTGVVTALFDDMKTSAEKSIVMTCGPEIMMRFVVRGLLARNFRRDQIYVSLERRMKCGMGHCGHCQIGPKFVCKDGPVFKYADLTGLPDLTL